MVSGVPQGSVLGPLLFLIYVNDLSNLKLSIGSSVVLYADDILLNKFQKWANANHMKFNESKCKVMHISRKRRPLSHSKSFILNNIILESVDSYKYLGLHISSNLSWSDHIESICRKGINILGLLYRKYYKFSNEATLLQLYKSLVRPHLEYAAAVWDPYVQRDVQKLHYLQKFACMLVMY